MGVIQGLTEFIPVSSTAHLIIAPQFLPITRPDEAIAHAYDTIIQSGTLFAALAYFWKDWTRILAALGRIIRNRGIDSKDLDERMVRYLILGSIPAGVLGLILEKKIDEIADPDKHVWAWLVLGAGLIGMGIVMWVVDANSRKTRDIENLKTPDALFIGCAQALALFPGVSRSGSTITAGLFTGLTREAAARFSFLLMTPIMIAATGYKLLGLLMGKHGEHVPSEAWGSMILATIVAGITGYLVIGFLLGWLRTRSLMFFVTWRLAVGALCVGMYFMQSHSHQPAQVPAVGVRHASHPRPIRDRNYLPDNRSSWGFNVPATGC